MAGQRRITPACRTLGVASLLVGLRPLKKKIDRALNGTGELIKEVIDLGTVCKLELV